MISKMVTFKLQHGIQNDNKKVLFCIAYGDIKRCRIIQDIVTKNVPYGIKIRRYSNSYGN